MVHTQVLTCIHPIIFAAKITMTLESNVRLFSKQWQLSSFIDYHINDSSSVPSPTAYASICWDWDIIHI